MNERNCYLIIDKVDRDKEIHARSALFWLFAKHHMSLEQYHFNAVSDMKIYSSFVGDGIVLDMFHLTQEEAEREIIELAEKGAHARIQYHSVNENDTTVDVSPISINSQNVLSDLSSLKQYLKDLYTLEKQLYCSQQAKDKTHSILNQLTLPNENIKIEGTEYNSSSSSFSLLFSGIFGAVAGYIVGWIALIFLIMLINTFTINFEISQTLDSILRIVPYAFAFIGFCLGIKKSKENGKRENLKYKLSSQKLAEDNIRIEKEKSLIPKYLETERLYTENVVSCKKTLEQLYSLDIIFPKYRNFIAISQIYEYFMSGRCTELEGHEGAYNIFENELRQNIIILQLNEAISNLEEIKHTQYMIYDAIQSCRSILSNIENNTSAIAYNSAVIAENTSIHSRYYY